MRALSAWAAQVFRRTLAFSENWKIEYVIANCAECEPYLTADYRRMLEIERQLIAGMKIILQLFDKALGVLAIEDNKPDCIEKLTELVKDEPRIDVCVLQNTISGRRASAHLCGNTARDQFQHASGRRELHRR